MATPTTLVELAQQRHAAWTAARAAAQTAAAQAQTDLNAANQALASAAGKFAEEERKAADIRAQLAAITTPADGEPLLDQLEQTIVEQHAAAAAILAAAAGVARAQAALAKEQASIQEAEARIADAKAGWDQSKADQARRQTAKDALTRAPLNALATRAGALLAGGIFNAAKARVEGDFPQALRDRARNRAKLARDGLARSAKLAADLAQLLDAHLAAKGAPADKLPGPAHAVEDAESTLLDWVARAKERCDRAEAALKRIGDPKNPPLTQEQKDRIGDAALKTEREAAAAKEQARDQARDVKAQEQAEFEVERVKVLGESGPDGLAQALADPTSDAAKAKKALDDAIADLQAKETAYTAAMRDTLDLWEAAVPESAWRDLSDFDQAGVTLQALQAGAASLVTALANAESALLAAGIAAEQEQWSLRSLRLEAQLPAAQAAQEAGAAARLAFSALRGDG